MKGWEKYDKETIFADKKKGGLLVTFLVEYKELFKLKTINASCGSCFSGYYDNYLKTLPMAEEKKEKCDYLLHKKYENITLKFGGVRIRNRDLTNKLAIELLNKHPHGEKLFSKIPKKKVVKKEVKKVIKK